MIVINCDQGSEEWHQSRAGVITASMFKTARARINGLNEQQQKYVDAILTGAGESEARDVAAYKTAPRADAIMRAIKGLPVGEPSGEARDYAFRLAIERISGAPLDEGFSTWQMKRGHELEPAARLEHEIQAGVCVDRTGFILTEDHLFGASADGLIDADGGSEYKCLVSPERLRAILIDGDFTEFLDQVQGCMWISGRRWWDFCLYCPALESIGRQLWWRRVRRDDTYIDAMVSDLRQFEQLVSENEMLLRMKESA